MIPFINLRKQYQSIREEILHVTDLVLSGGVLMNGPYTSSFEEQLGKRIGYNNVIAVHSGTQALEMIAQYHMYQNDTFSPNNELTVLVPALTYPATINAWMRAGWKVVIGDVDSRGNLDLKKISNKQDFNAICMVGLYGHPVWPNLLNDEDYIYWLRYKILVEDAAQHWLAEDQITLPIMKAISFDPMKNLANYGNGGAIATYDSESANWFRSYRENGKPNWLIDGTNSRMSEVDCAQMIVKLKYLDDWQERRQEIAKYYLERFSHYEEIGCLIDNKSVHQHGLQKFVIAVDHRNHLVEDLRNSGIECKVHYERPLHEEALYSEWPNPGALSVASVLSRRVLSLPFYPELTDSEIEYVADEVIAHATN
jgi:dTDP-4-amino-4,6-dideoxygalactose transaminase